MHVEGKALNYLMPCYLRALRGWLGLTQSEVADLAGVGRRTLRAKESGGDLIRGRVVSRIERLLRSRGIRPLVLASGRPCGFLYLGEAVGLSYTPEEREEILILTKKFKFF